MLYAIFNFNGPDGKNHHLLFHNYKYGISPKECEIGNSLYGPKCSCWESHGIINKNNIHGLDLGKINLANESNLLTDSKTNHYYFDFKDEKVKEFSPEELI